MISANQRLEQLRTLAIETAQDMARTEALFLSIGDGAISTDEEGCIERVNQTALTILGFEEKDLLGKVFHEVIVAADDQGVPIPEDSRPIMRSSRSGKTVMTRCYYVRKDGSYVPVSITVSPILLEGKQVGAVEVFRDITREIEIEHTQSDFISIASHQLRTPATAVKTYLAMLSDGMAGELTDMQKKYLKLAFESNERQLNIVNDLLLTASSEAGSLVLKKQPTDIGQLMQATVDDFATIIEQRQHAVQLDIAGSVVASVDPSYMKMVFENLMSNACKYTPKQGRIVIRLSSDDEMGMVSIEDNGVGINSQQRSKLFKKFSRIENALSGEAGGSGIGLYLLNQIVELHGGAVSVDSEEDKGTKFTVTFRIK